MTYAQFLAALRKTPRRWEIIGGEIRCRIKGHTYCPITAVEGGQITLGRFDQAAINLQIARTVVETIVPAADNWTICNSRTRRDLLKACGLKEPK